jgi:hypothetical protein
MNANDRSRAAGRTLDERLWAAGSALREASAAQVDAATGLREIVHGANTVSDDQALPLAAHALDLAAVDAPPPAPPRRLLQASQRLALVVNLLLVVALSVVLVRVAGSRREPASANPVPATTTVVPQGPVPAPAATLPQATVPASTSSRVPEACLDATELADEIISRLNRKQRDNALALDLTDYAVASQACRREANP